MELTVREPLKAVSGDSERLQQVIWQLLANAMKFTPSNGKVQLLLRSRGGNAEVIVSDTGEGVSAEFLPNLFEPFNREDLSTTRKHGGIGMGLAVVRSLVEAHGGTIRASSNGAGHGTKFVVRLPIFQESFMKTGVDIVRSGVYATDCCLAEIGLEQRQTFPRCPECLGLTVWMPVRFTSDLKRKKAA